MLNGIIGVYYREMTVLRTRLWRSIAASMISPALFMIAFGYGLGRYQSFDGLPYISFLFAGLLAMATLNACFGVGTDINIARFYLKVFDEYLIAPIGRWQIVLGEMLFGITKGCISVVIFFAYALIAGIAVNINLIFVLALLMHMAVFALLGFIVALSVKRHGDQFAINTFIITPMTFLSGVFFPLEQAPAVLYWIMQVFPITHSVSLMRGSLMDTGINLIDFVVLGGYLVVFFLWALHLAKKAEG